MKTLRTHTQMVILLLLVFIVGIANAQDVIITKGSECIEDYEIREIKIHSKKANNLSSPTFAENNTENSNTKPQNNRMLIQPTFKQGEFWDFATCSSTFQPSSNYYHCISGNEIVKQIDIFYANSTFDRIRSYIEQLPSCVNRNCIQQYYLERFYQSCDDENRYGIIRYGETYLKTGGEAKLPTVLPMIAKMHAIQGNEAEVEELINEFELFSTVNDDLFEADIEQLKQETYDLLHPKRFEDEIKGAWVNISNYKIVQHGAANPMILFIDDVAKPKGARLLEDRQSINLMTVNGKQSVLFDKPINISQDIYFNGDSRLMALQFASVDIKDRIWLTDIASTGVEDTRKLGAELNATIWSSNASLGDKALYGITTSLLVGGLESLFSNMNYSTKSIENYKIILLPHSDNVLSAQMAHVSATADNEGHFKEKHQDKEDRFVRWEESDSIFFVSKNGKPITLNPISKNDPLLEEYYNIKKQTSFWQPKYSIPFFAGNALGGYLLYTAIKTEKNNPEITDTDWRFLGPFVGGCMAILVSSSIPTKASEKRDKLFQELNEKNIEKLQRKFRAEISIEPSYNPTNNAMGATVNVKF